MQAETLSRTKPKQIASDCQQLVSYRREDPLKVGSKIIGGQGGGGRKDFAQAGGQDQSKIEEAFEKLKTLI